MVMMGALSRATGAVKMDQVESILMSFFPESKHNLIPLNVKAIKAGQEAISV
jgi:Pyruvate/2-oxoacid:ferredoxin oxidoreductase gamma subunit